MAALSAGGLLVAPSAFAADSVTQAVIGGTRSASVAAMSLASVVTAHTVQNNTGTMTLTVDDSSGTGAGWNVTEQVSDFAYSGSNSGTAIPASAFSITSVGAVASTAGEAISNTGTDGAPTGPQSANITNGVSGSLDTAVKVIRAGANYGSGTYTQPINVNLAIPADTRAGTYTATLTTTLAAAP
ncbi:WxL domain-containing protein [Arthrobacter sp. NPDC080073]|uniref:WxL domain-containing protein n=1 Tax=Arthrobacter sp. NPDC080073 TaxID=3155919 RepID=UPI003439D442